MQNIKVALPTVVSLILKTKIYQKKILKKLSNYFLSFLSAKNNKIINIIVHKNTDIVLIKDVSAPQILKNKAPKIIPIA